MEDMIPILVILFYIFSTIFSYLKRVASRQGGEPEQSTESEPNTVEGMLQEIRRQVAEAAGEPVVPGEHRRTPGEHQKTASEHRPTPSERRPRLSDHLQTPSEVNTTRSEHELFASEHMLSESEHTKGDAQLPPIPRLGPASVGHHQSEFGKALVKDLKGGGSLARAVVLQEILGPPVSLRPGGHRSGMGMSS